MLLATTVIHSRELENELNKVLDLRHINDGEFINSERLKFVVDEDYVNNRCSRKTLLEIMKTEGNRDRALGDSSKCMFRLRHLRERLTEVARQEFIKNKLMDSDHSIKISGHGWYPKDSYMGWHTNRCTHGTRVYCNWAEESGKSGLYYYYEGYDTERRVMLDDKGWNFRVFSTSSKLPFWHAVFSHTDRVSVGFRLSKDKPNV